MRPDPNAKTGPEREHSTGIGFFISLLNRIQILDIMTLRLNSVCALSDLVPEDRFGFLVLKGPNRHVKNFRSQ